MYNATVNQRVHILQQLEEAERNARDALFALEMIEMELTRKTAAMRSTISHLSKTLPPHEFEKMCGLAFGQSKNDWEIVWKREWVEDGSEKNKTTQPIGPSKRQSESNPQPPPPVHNPPSSPLPPSSPPPPTSPLNPQGHPPPRTGPVHTNGTPIDESQLPTRPHSPPTVDGFKTPWGFVDNFGSTRYQPTLPEPVAGPSRSQQSRRLKRDLRRLEVDQTGKFTLVDTREEIDAYRREMRERMRLQAQRRFSAQAEASLMKIVQRGNVHDHNHAQDPPVTWFRVFDDKKVHPNDMTNPFAQDDHVHPPAYLERDGDEQEPESETNPHVQGDQQ